MRDSGPPRRRWRPRERHLPRLCTCRGPQVEQNRAALQEHCLFISPGAVPMKAPGPTKTFAQLAQATNRFGTKAKNNYSRDVC